MSERKKSIIACTIAGTVAAGGAVVLVAGLLTPVTFGWFAYQPLADATFDPGAGGVLVSRTTIVGGVVLAIGLVAVAFLVGRGTAQRRPDRSDSESAI